MSDIHCLTALREDAGGDKEGTETFNGVQKKWEIRHDKGESGWRQQTQKTNQIAAPLGDEPPSLFSPGASLLSVCLCVCGRCSPSRSIISIERPASETEQNTAS